MMQIEVLKSKIHRIIASFAAMDFNEAKKFKPAIAFPDGKNKISPGKKK